MLERWYRAASLIRKTTTAPNRASNVNEIHEIVPVTNKYDLWHSQEGIVNCRIARIFAYLLEMGTEVINQAVFSDTSRIVGAAHERTCPQRPAGMGR